MSILCRRLSGARLREQLRQERFKNETFRQFATERLDVHDDALGLDTGQMLLMGSTASS